MMRYMIRIVGCMTVSWCMAFYGHAVAAGSEESEAEVLAEQIMSDDAAVAQGAIETIERRIQEDPGAGYRELRSRWAQAMIKAGRCEKLPQMALEGILYKPSVLLAHTTLQRARVQALLQLNRPREALVAARSLYNVVPMDGTAQAIELLSQCMEAAYPNDPDIARRFRLEQLAGATFPAAGADAPAAQPALTSAAILRGQSPAPQPILDAIVVDPTPYDETLAAVSGDDWDAWRTRVMLLLLANRTAEAQDAAERAYAVAHDGAVPKASELIAMAIRARDGCIGRANAWAIAIQPAASE